MRRFIAAFVREHKFATPGGEATTAPAWSPDGKRIAVGYGKVVRTWDTAADAENRMEGERDGPLLAVAWSPDGKRLASVARDDRAFRVWDAVTGKQQGRFAVAVNAMCPALAWSPDGKALALGFNQEPHGLFDPDTGRQLRALGSQHSVLALAWSPDGSRVALSGTGGTRVHDAETGKVRLAPEPWDEHQDFRHLSWSPDGRRLAVGRMVWGNVPASVQGVEVSTGRRAAPSLVGGGPAAGWSPDGKLLAASPSNYGECLVIDAATGAVRVRTQGGPYQFNVLWSSDGKTFTTIAHDGIRVWDATSGQLRRNVPHSALPGGAGLAAWSPDGRLLALGDGHQVSLDDAEGLPLGVLLPSDTFAHLAITPDGHYRGTARLDRAARVVVQKRDGTSETLTLADFEHRYGFKNDPDKVRLVE